MALHPSRFQGLQGSRGDPQVPPSCRSDDDAEAVVVSQELHGFLRVFKRVKAPAKAPAQSNLMVGNTASVPQRTG
jgi:hypothetical protein